MIFIVPSIILITILPELNVKVVNYHNPLERSNTQSLRGLFSVIIILYHLHQHIDNKSILLAFEMSGPLIVGYFFFVSGYGLMDGLLHNNDYLNGFIRKRFVKILLPYIVITIIYCIVYFVTNNFGIVLDNIKETKNGCLIISNSWYIVIALLFYFIYFVSFKITRTSGKAIIIVFIIDAFISGLLAVTHFGGWWYVSNMAFPLGLFYRHYKDKIEPLIKRKYFLFLSILAIVFILFCLLYLHYSSAIFKLLFLSALVIIFVSLCIFTGYKIHIVGILWSSLGRISLELYLIHELVYKILRSNAIYIHTDAVYVMVVLSVSIILAFFLYKFDSMLIKVCGKRCK